MAHDAIAADQGMKPMHRVRVGLIGLAWVFLLVMLATTFVHLAGGDRPGANSAAVTRAPIQTSRQRTRACGSIL